jgi:fucose permease
VPHPPDARGNDAPGEAGADRSSILVAAYASFTLIGWTGLLVPSYLRVIRDEFGQTDAGFGLVYLIFALLFGAGALSAGVLADRIGRRVVVPAAALLVAVGLAMESVAPGWAVFVVGAGLAGAGCGAIDAAVNSVVMDLSVIGGGSSLNRLHLFYSVGALTAPLVIGVLAEAGIGWRLVTAATGLAALSLALPLRRVGAVPPRRRTPGDDASERRSPTPIGLPLRLALVALAIAIACYVAAEAGVSSWLVGFLADESMSVATMALAFFWAGLAAGRLVASRVADRFDPVVFTTTCAFASAVALLAAIACPPGPLRIALFMATGFAFGPVYPMIMTVAGALAPHRAAAVSGLLTAAAVAGSVVYPPLMGLVSGLAGLGAGMVGAALLAAVSGLAVVGAGWVAARPGPAGPAGQWDHQAR